MRTPIILCQGRDAIAKPALPNFRHIHGPVGVCFFCFPCLRSSGGIGNGSPRATGNGKEPPAQATLRRLSGSGLRGDGAAQGFHGLFEEATPEKPTARCGCLQVRTPISTHSSKQHESSWSWRHLPAYHPTFCSAKAS